MVKKIAIIGCGGFGETWELSIKQLKLEVKALIEVNDIVRKKYADIYRVDSANLYKNNEEVPWDKLDVDMVIDCTPPRGRVKRAEFVLNSGKILLTTKPAAESIDELEKLIELSQKSSQKIYVAQQKRYFPAYLYLKEVIDNNYLGKLVYVEINLRCNGLFWEPGKEWRTRMPYPPLLDGSIHHFDLLNQFINKRCVSISASSWNEKWSPFDGDASFQATLKYEDNVVAHYLARWAPQRESEIVHYFSGMHIEFENGVVEVKDGKIYLNQKYIPIHDDGEEKMDISKLNFELLKDLFKCIENKKLDGNRLEIKNHYSPFCMMIGTQKSIEMRQEVDMLGFFRRNIYA